jgi:hypothetical protein
MSDRNGNPAEELAVAALRLRGAKDVMTALAEAYEAANQAGDCRWQFSVEAKVLREQGASLSVLRSLVRAGLAEHRQEFTRRHDIARKFKPLANLSFPQRACLTLTDAGAELAQSSPGALDSEGTKGATNTKTPHWDPLRRELWFAGQLVKAYRVPAANQQRVLAAFEAAGWPSSIADPLDSETDQTRDRQLNRTIQKLNHANQQDLIRFHGDGTGQRICWELRE